MMTPSQIKDIVLARLTDGQGPCKAPGEGGEDYCVYRRSDGLQCAVGCLIPEEVYDPEAEGSNVCNLGVNMGHWEARRRHHADLPPNENDIALANMLTAAGVPPTVPVLAFLAEAQRMHDRPSAWNPPDIAGKVFMRDELVAKLRELPV